MEGTRQAMMLLSDLEDYTLVDIAKRYWVYGLIDPRNNELRYIGLSNNPIQRYEGHRPSRNNTTRGDERSEWLKSLMGDGKEPLLIYLEEVKGSENKALFVEAQWIIKCLDFGARLLNGQVESKRRMVEKLIILRVLQIMLDNSAAMFYFLSMKKSKKLKTPSVRHSGTTKLLKSIPVDKFKLLDPTKVSTVNNLHTLAGRLKMKIATRMQPSGKLKVFRLE